MLALGIETESEETRKDMMKRLDGEKIRQALMLAINQWTGGACRSDTHSADRR